MKTIKKTVIAMIIMIVLVVIVGILFWKTHWIPSKHSIKEETFSQYQNYILVKEVFYTGTGWIQIGDEKGYFDLDKIKDINLSGEELPYSKMSKCTNAFLCVIEYEGLMEHTAFAEPINNYKVLEWHPVYPIVRDSILPSWMLPADFMTEKEMKSY